MALTTAIGQSDAFLTFQEQLSRVAGVNRPVLILGERGTGKELAASRIHFHSPRWDKPLVALNCAALSPGLVESELFGHEPGAFTGAAGKHPGRFERADGGTLFLDEIGNMPLSVQEKILRVIEYHRFERVGGREEITVDVRIIAATNRDLAIAAGEGSFLPDLLDRLSFEVIRVPPLRERREDILLLATHFASRMAVELGWDRAPELSPQAVEQLYSYEWPGNVRECKNVMERTLFHSDARHIDQIRIHPLFQLQKQTHPEKPSPAALTSLNLPDARRDLEVTCLREALRRCAGKQKEAAQLLGLSYDQFRGLYRKRKRAL